MEVANAKGSARLLHLSTANSVLLPGERFDPVTLGTALYAGGRSPLLLYPETDDMAAALAGPALLAEPAALRLVVLDGAQVLLQQRAQSGIWGGLMSLPEVDGHGARGAIDDGAVDAAARIFGAVDEVQSLLPLVHVFTHYRLHIAPFKVALAERGPLPEGYLWWKLADIERAPLPAPVKKLLLDIAAPSLFT